VRYLVYIALAVSLVGCKSKGTAQVDIEFCDDCAGRNDATDVRIYTLAGATCAACECGGCFSQCNDDNCTVACDGGFCSVDDLDDLTVEPPGSGLYAIIFEYSYVDGDGIRRLGATACAEIVLDEDGTTDNKFFADTACCEGTCGADAGP
jgi:hypothetical protein